MKRIFPTEIVLSVVKGVLLCKIDQVYEILNWLLDENLFTHQLPRAGRFVQPIIEKQFPWIATIDVSHINCDNCQEELKKILSANPKEVELTKIEGWQHKNAIQEAIEMKGNHGVTVVKI